MRKCVFRHFLERNKTCKLEGILSDIYYTSPLQFFKVNIVLFKGIEGIVSSGNMKYQTENEPGA